MKQQTAALFFCALLLSTFAHDFRRAGQQAPPALKHHKSHDKSLSHFQSKDNDQCFEFCTDSNSNGKISVTITVNVETRSIGILNTTSNIGIIINYESGIVVIVNGATGDIILYNIATGEGVFVGGQLSGNIGWIARNQTFEEYIIACKNFREVFKAAQRVGVKFSKTSISSPHLQFTHDCLVNVDSVIVISSSQSLTYLTEISQAVIASFRQLEGLITGGTCGLGIGLIGFVNRIQGIDYLLLVLNIEGGIELLLQKGITFSLNLIANINSGIKIFSYISSCIQSSINIDAYLIKIPDNTIFFDLLSRLHVQVNVFSVVSGIISVVSSETLNIPLLREVLITLINYLGASTTVSVQEWQEYLQVLIRISAVFANSPLIKALINGSLVINGVDISAIISLLLKVEAVKINILIGVLILLQEAISLAILIPMLIVLIMSYICSEIGLKILRLIFPTIKALEQGLLGIIGSLLRINLIALFTGNIYGFLISVPIVGEIIKALQAALGDLSADVDLKVSVNAGGKSSSLIPIIQEIWQLLRALLRGDTSASQDANSHINGGGWGLNVINSTSSYNSSSHWEYAVNSTARRLERHLEEFAIPIHKQHQLEKHHRAGKHHEPIADKHL